MSKSKSMGRCMLAALMLSAVLAACGGTPATSIAAPATTAPKATIVPQATTAPQPTTNSSTAMQSAPTATVAAEPTTAPVSTVAAKINLNTATAEQLLAGIPNFGNRMVREFQEYRPYSSILQFRREIGKYVDQAQVAEYEKYVYVPIDMNNSDAATLLQIPGLEAAEADQLIAKRPFASNDAFLTELAQFVSADEAAIAKTYLNQP